MKPMEYKKEIAARLKKAMADYEARNGYNLSFPAFSRLCNGVLKKSALSNYANAIREPGPYEATIMATALGCDAAWLLCLRGEQGSVPDVFEREVIELYRSIDPDYREGWLANGRRLPQRAELQKKETRKDGKNAAEKPKTKAHQRVSV